MKRVAALAVIAFAGTAGAVIANRMGTEAMAVVIGVVCGVVASIPASLLILAVSVRRNGRQEEWRQTRPANQMPPVVVIQGGQPSQLNVPQLPTSPRWQSAPRTFEVVGQDEEVWG
jgi:hypothetical protein